MKCKKCSKYLLNGINGALALSILFLVGFLYSFDSPEHYFSTGETKAAVITWDGEAVSDNWSDCDNWSGNTCPGASDVATFDGTSTDDSIIDAGFAGSVAGIDINAGYTGTITQARSLTVGTSCYIQDTATWNTGANTLTVDTTCNRISGGTLNVQTGGHLTMEYTDYFTVNGGTLDLTDGTATFGTLYLTSGTMEAPSGTMYIQGPIYYIATTLNHNNGTTVFNHWATGYIFFSGPSNLTLYNVEIAKTEDWAYVDIAAGKSLTVEGSLTLTKGYINNTGSLYAQGDVTVGADFGSISTDLNFTGSNTQNLDVSADTSILDTNLVINKAGGAVVLASDLVLDSTDQTLTITNGTLDASASDYNITLANDWTNNGTFTPRAGTVTITDVAQTTTFAGDTTFYNLTCSIDSKAIQFTAGSTTTVSGTLTLAGTSGNEISLRSTSDGTQWLLNNSGTNAVEYVDVKDSDASGGNEIVATSSTDSGNNDNWDFGTSGSATPSNPVTEVSVEITDIVKTDNGVIGTVLLQAKNAKEVLLSESNLFQDATWELFIQRTGEIDQIPTMETEWRFADADATDFVLFALFRSDTGNTALTSDEKSFSSDGEQLPDESGGDVVEVDTIQAGDYIQSETLDDVYYVAENDLGTLVRRSLVDILTFYTYEPTFSIVKKVTDESIALFAFDRLMLYKPGVVLVSFQSRPEVYAVQKNVNHPETPILFELSADQAVQYIGDDWRDYVIEMEDTLYPRFIFGGPVTSKNQVDRSKMTTLKELKESVEEKK